MKYLHWLPKSQNYFQISLPKFLINFFLIPFYIQISLRVLIIKNFAAVLELRSELDARMFCVDETDINRPDVVTLPQVLASLPSDPLEEKVAGYNDPIFYIYTSGTTGSETVAFLSLSSSELFFCQVFLRQQSSNIPDTCLPAIVFTAWVWRTRTTLCTRCCRCITLLLTSVLEWQSPRGTPPSPGRSSPPPSSGRIVWRSMLRWAGLFWFDQS